MLLPVSLSGRLSQDLRQAWIGIRNAVAGEVSDPAFLIIEDANRSKVR